MLPALNPLAVPKNYIAMIGHNYSLQQTATRSLKFNWKPCSSASSDGHKRLLAQDEHPHICLACSHRAS